MNSEAQQTEQLEERDAKPLCIADWLWRPWYAKLWWSIVPIYWVGGMASVKVTALAGFYDTLLANCLAIFCNPFIALLFLGVGYARAKLDRGEWILTPGPVEMGRRPGELLDPSTDFTDPRSGIRYLEHRGVFDQNH